MASEACNAVYKEGRKVVAQCNRLQTKMEAAVLKASQSRARQGRSMEPTASQSIGDGAFTGNGKHNTFG